MTKILIDEATVKLVLEALEGLEALLLSMGLTHLIVYGDAEKAITNLQEALAEQPAQTATYTCGVCGVPMQMEQPAQQEPVAWMDGYRNIYSLEEKAAGCEDAVIPLVPAILRHWSDCAVHNEPAYPAGKCDCAGYTTPQPAQQEPVECANGCRGFFKHHPPAQRKPLTKVEVDSWDLPDHPTVFEFAQFVEAKLKEKNT